MWHQNELLIKTDPAWRTHACMRGSLQSVYVFAYLHVLLSVLVSDHISLQGFSCHAFKTDKGNLLYLGPVDKAISLKTSTALKKGSRY